MLPNEERIYAHLSATVEWMERVKQSRRTRDILEAEAFYRGMIAGLLAAFPSEDVMLLVHRVNQATRLAEAA